MSEVHRYVILGAGRQGTAAAYDLARFGDAERILMADRDVAVAERAAARVNRLVGGTLAEARPLDVTDDRALRALLTGARVTLSAVPYYFNLGITRAAVEAGTHLCDMGGHTATVRSQLALDAEARAKGVSIVPDCGMGPGLIVTLAAFVMELLDEPREVYLYDGGLPQQPLPPWNYRLTFHINGLTNEMDGQAVFLRDGKVTLVDTLSEPETVEVPGLGRLEADVASGGLSTSPWTFEGRLQRYENKVLRYPGHFEWLRAYKALGLFSETAIDLDGRSVVPRQLYHALLGPRIDTGDLRDICVMRAKGVGRKNGREATVLVDLVDRYDEATGFTAMERLTGWHCAIMMGFQARGQVRPGGVPMETAVSASAFMDELRRRGIGSTVTIE